MRSNRHLWLTLLSLALTLALVGVACDNGGNGGDDDDDYTGPTDASINLNVFGTVDETEGYELLSMFSGEEEIVACGPDAQTEEANFELKTSGDLLDPKGVLNLSAGGFLTDIELYAEQSINPEEDGGTYEVEIPERPGDPLGWVAGTCYLYVRTGADGCNDPAIPYCGNFSCGTEEEPLENGAGDTGRFTGTFNCYD